MPVADYTWREFLCAFWDTSIYNTVHKNHYPICYQFWFIRDLIVVVILSPIIWVLNKKLKGYAILALAILWYFGWWPHVVGLSSEAVFFFSAGAYFSIYKYNFATKFQPVLPVMMTIFSILIIFILYAHNQTWIGYLKNACILVGMVFFISLTAYMLKVEKWKSNMTLAGCSFFVYAYHAMPLLLIQKFSFKIFTPQSDGALLAIYFGSTFLIVLIGIFLCLLIKRYMPKPLVLCLTGGR